MAAQNRLIIEFEGERREIAGDWQSASALDLVGSAEWLPAGSVPYRLLRAGKTVGFYDSTCPLSVGRDGDVLEVIVDHGQDIEIASFAGVLRKLREFRLDALALAHGIGLAQSHSPAA